MKTRIISSVIMLLIVAPIIFLGGLPFKIFAMAISIIALYELLKVRKEKKEMPKLMKILSYLFVLVLIYFSNDYYQANFKMDFRVLSFAFLLFLVPVVLFNNNKKYNITDALYLTGAALFLSIGFNSFIIINDFDTKYLLYIAIITMTTDTFAMVSGKLVGKHKLCEGISPNKTIEGTVGGSVIGTIIASLFYYFVISQSANMFIVVGITLFLSLMGQIGDLLFSSIKRYYKVKDFSNLIPGHGGILDRLDSLVFVALTYLLFMGII